MKGGCETAERVVVEINGETFDVFPSPANVNLSSNLAASLLLEPRGGGFNLLLNPDGTYARVSGGITNETGMYSLTALEDYRFALFHTNGNNVGLSSLTGLEYILEESTGLPKFSDATAPVPGTGSTIQFAPDTVNTTGFFRIRAQ